MKKILFVCHGNICRSPMAEYIFKNITDNKYEIASRATSNEEIGNDIYPDTKKILDKYQIPYQRHYAKRMTLDDYNYYDYIVAFDDYNVSNIRRMVNDDKKIIKIIPEGVDDPWYTRDFERAYRDILKGCLDLYKKLKNEEK